MPNRPNPYYSGGFQHRPIAELFRDLVNLSDRQQKVSAVPSQIEANQARADASLASAGLNRAKATGQLDKNAAMTSSPAMLAELFMSGGKVTDDFRMAPDWRERMDANTMSLKLPSDFLATGQGLPEYQPITSGMSAQDKIAQAIQEALIRGVSLPDIAKFAGQGGYLNQVNAGTPDAGMGYIPLFGSNPTTNTALSTTRQDAISARDAGEQQTRELAVQGLRNQGSLDVAAQQGRNQTVLEGIRQQGRERLVAMKFEVGPDGKIRAGAKPPATPNISTLEVKRIRESVDTRAKEMNLTLESSARDAIVSEITRRMQTPNTDTFRNPMTALDSVLQDLQDNVLPGVESSVEQAPWYKIFGSDKTVVKRAPGAAQPAAPQPAAPQPAAPKLRKDPDTLARARDAIAKGAPRDAVIRRLTDNGIDPSGL